jgi:hypothetical protein
LTLDARIILKLGKMKKDEWLCICYKTELLPTQNTYTIIIEEIKMLLLLKVHLCILFDTN